MKVSRLLTCVMIVGLCVLGSWGASRMRYSRDFDQECSAHIYKAAAARDLRTARIHLEVALSYVRECKATVGTTHLPWEPQSWDSACNIGLWYDALCLALETTHPKSDVQEAASLALIRGYLTEPVDSRSVSSYNVWVPPGISVYPYNLGFALLGWPGALLFFGSGITLLLRFLRKGS